MPIINIYIYESNIYIYILLVIANFTVLVTYFSIFSTVPLPAVTIFEMITRIRIEQTSELISRSFDLIADRLYSYTMYRKRK